VFAFTASEPPHADGILEAICPWIDLKKPAPFNQPVSQVMLVDKNENVPS
jgi:hypothetical protein